MPELNLIENIPQQHQPEAPETNQPVTSGTLKLQVMIRYIIDSGIKGEEQILKVAKEHDIKLSYQSIRRKLAQYNDKGVTAFTRKEKSGKGDLKSFSNEVLLKLDKVFGDRIRGGCAVRAYEDVHKYLRGISREFIVADTGEVFLIHDGYLCEVDNQNIISQYTTKFVSGVYRLKPENIQSADCELSIGSKRSAERFLKSIKDNNADALFLNRFGIYDFRNKRQHTMKLNYSNLQPNDLITGDGKLLDVLVISDDWKRVYRPWLMGWQDAATRRYCYAIAETESSESIANSLSVAINKWGIPKKTKHDNGKAYKSGRFAQMKQAFSIDTHFATVKLARAKMIESLHNIIDQLMRTQIGYTGNKYQEFPQDTRERLKLVAGEQRNIKKLEKLFKDSTPDDNTRISISGNMEARLKQSKKRFMHISELTDLLECKFEEYHERIQGGLDKDTLGKEVYNINCKDKLITEAGKSFNSPNGRFSYYQKKGFIPVTADASVVSLYAMNIEMRTVQLKTGISLNNEEYYHSSLAKYAGDKVLIRYTSKTANIIYVFHSSELQMIADRRQLTNEIIQSLKFICVADKQRLIDYNDATFKDELLIQRSEEKRLCNAVSQNSIKPDTASIHSLTGIESQIPDIHQAEDDYKILKLQKEKPFKKLKSIWDD